MSQSTKHHRTLGRSHTVNSYLGDIDAETLDLSGNPIEKVAHHRISDVAEVEKFYEMKELLGRGSFGKVILLKAKTAPHGKWAGKIIKKRLGKTESMVQLEREILILKRVRHLSIVALREVFDTPDKAVLVMEYCDGGSLTNAMRTGKIRTEQDVNHIVRTIADALAYLHDHRVVHRDVKPDNILLTTKSLEDTSDFQWTLKLTDFGLVTFVDACDTIATSVGTPLFMAPEVYNGQGYSQQCDVWSLGVIYSQILTGEFKRLPIKLNATKQSKVEYPPALWGAVPTAAHEFVELMLQFNPAERITAREILQHHFFKRLPSAVSETSSKKLLPTVINMMRAFNAERKLRKVALAVYAMTVWMARTRGSNENLTSLESSFRSTVASPFVSAYISQDQVDASKHVLDGDLLIMSQKLSNSFPKATSKPTSPVMKRALRPRSNTVGTPPGITSLAARAIAERKPYISRSYLEESSKALQLPRLSKITGVVAAEPTKSRNRSASLSRKPDNFLPPV